MQFQKYILKSIKINSLFFIYLIILSIFFHQGLILLFPQNQFQFQIQNQEFLITLQLIY